MTDNELKPCENCGGKAILTGGCFPLDVKYYVICTKCQKSTELLNTEDQAVAAWNRRV